jgi:hypothetical protein
MHVCGAVCTYPFRMCVFYGITSTVPHAGKKMAFESRQEFNPMPRLQFHSSLNGGDLGMVRAAALMDLGVLRQSLHSEAAWVYVRPSVRPYPVLQLSVEVPLKIVFDRVVQHL